MTNLEDKYNSDKLLEESNRSALEAQKKTLNQARDAFELHERIFSTLGVHVYVEPGRHAYLKCGRETVEIYQTNMGSLYARWDAPLSGARAKGNSITTDVQSLGQLVEWVALQAEIFERLRYGYLSPATAPPANLSTVQELVKAGMWKLEEEEQP